MSTSQKRPIVFGLMTVLLVAGMAMLAGCGAGPTVQTHPTSTPIPPTATATNIPPTATSAPPATISTPPARSVVTASIVGVTMFSTANGWGEASATANPGNVTRITHTADGGHTWYDVTPAGLKPNLLWTIALYPLSSQEAWIWIPAYVGNGPTALWHTADAGAHWASSVVATGAIRQLDFVDSMHGWLTATPAGNEPSQLPVEVWRTMNGGITWANVAFQPVGGRTIGISFVNASTGFATAANNVSGSLTLSVTHDGGYTWKGVSLANPIDFSPNYGWSIVEPPVFTSPTDGILMVTYPMNEYGIKTGLATYRTTNAGTTWTLSPSGYGPENYIGRDDPLFLTSTTATGTIFEAPVAANAGTELCKLPFGASAWVCIVPTVGSRLLLFDMSQVDFSDATHGWAVTRAGLIRTTDGGVTWTMLHV